MELTISIPQTCACKQLADIVCYSTKTIVVHIERDNFRDFLSTFISAILAEKGKLDGLFFEV